MKIVLLNEPVSNGGIDPITKGHFEILEKRVSELYPAINIKHIEDHLTCDFKDHFVFIEYNYHKRGLDEKFAHWEQTIEGFLQLRRRIVLLNAGDRGLQGSLSQFSIAGATIDPRAGYVIRGWPGRMHHSPFFMGIKEVIEQMKTGEVRNWPESLPTSENEFHYIGAHEKEPVDPFLVLVEYLELYEKYMKEKGLL